jgi:CheY-like chemotaxis protein
MSQSGFHILIADDDNEDLDMIEESLLKARPDADLHKVNSGKAVIEYLNTKRNDELPCLVVLDYSMPELNGLQVLSIICSTPRLEKIPVVMLSTSNSLRHIEECKEQGAVEYFVKPNTFAEFDKIAKSILALCN